MTLRFAHVYFSPMMAKKREPGEETVGQKGVDCFSCTHFHITYDTDFPYGCRAAGFKSRFIPAKEMLLNSGMACQFFEEKKMRRGR